MQMLEITMFRFVTTQIRLLHPDLIHHMPNGTLRTIVHCHNEHKTTHNIKLTIHIFLFLRDIFKIENKT